MKRLALVILSFSFVALSFNALGASYFTLHGYKIGQPLQLVKKQFGEPDKVFPFPDGWKAYAFRRKGYNVIFETDNTRPDLIISIQIEGEHNPAHMGLDGIDLGSDAKKAIRILGKPAQRKASKDLATKKPVPNTFINYYNGGLSFEEKDNKVKSIKILFSGAVQAGDRPGFDQFLKNVREKNYYRVAEGISSGMTLRGNQAVNGPIVEQISGKTELHRFLFDKKGLASITSKDIADVNMRIIASDREKGLPGSTGWVYKFNNTATQELYFVRSFEGWVLFDAQ